MFSVKLCPVRCRKAEDQRAHGGVEAGVQERGELSVPVGRGSSQQVYRKRPRTTGDTGGGGVVCVCLRGCANKLCYFSRPDLVIGGSVLGVSPAWEHSIVCVLTFTHIWHRGITKVHRKCCPSLLRNQRTPLWLFQDK